MAFADLRTSLKFLQSYFSWPQTSSEAPLVSSRSIDTQTGLESKPKTSPSKLTKFLFSPCSVLQRKFQHWCLFQCHSWQYERTELTHTYPRILDTCTNMTLQSSQTSSGFLNVLVRLAPGSLSRSVSFRVLMSRVIRDDLPLH